MSSYSGDDYDLGILLVHGIGTQRPGETLVNWVDSVVKTIERATRGEVLVFLKNAGSNDPQGRTGMSAVLELHHGDHRERWLVREAWWAESFPPPSYKDLVIWSVRALPWSLAMHVAERYWRVQGGILDKARGLAVAGLRIILLLAFSPLLLGLIALSLVVGILPSPQIRTAIIAVQATLTASIGDCYVFATSPVRAALICGCIREGLKALDKVCRKKIIVAHSQGAAATLDSLQGLQTRNRQSSSQNRTFSIDDLLVFIMDRFLGYGLYELEELPPIQAELVPNRLITFGAGIKKLAVQKLLVSHHNPRLLPPSAVTCGIWAIWTLFALCAWFYYSVHCNLVSLTELQRYIENTLLIVGVYGAIIAPISYHLIRFARTVGGHGGDLVFIFVAVLIVSISLLVALLLVTWKSGTLPAMFVLALVTFLAYTLTIIHSELLVQLDRSIRMPIGLEGWLDLYADADPVSNGPTKVFYGDKSAEEHVSETGFQIYRSVKLFNSGSLLFDHTSYWSNYEGFVLRVVRYCAETAQSQWLRQLPPDHVYIDQRAEWRLCHLQIAQAVSAIVLVFLSYFSWTRFGNWLPNTTLSYLSTLFAVTNFNESTVAVANKLIYAVGLTLIAGYIFVKLIELSWRKWTDVEQDRTLRQEGYGGEPRISLFLMWSVIGIQLLIIVIETISVEQLGAHQNYLPLVLIFPLLFGILSAALLLSIWPPPVGPYDFPGANAESDPRRSE